MKSVKDHHSAASRQKTKRRRCCYAPCSVWCISLCMLGIFLLGSALAAGLVVLLGSKSEISASTSTTMTTTTGEYVDRAI
ncbi:unnamed protein product [Rotaria magnacalcarata]|uniref:Uncharacterized protein n=1 Tax=Rotaria magnacalcarata TaxID=392030 RepID=A0A820L6E0_9BILA|nr:unnamed protein product [Rotaria magnacalcarata]CAF4485660.1 unnamed protein product [Rotaria magnacalcarata]